MNSTQESLLKLLLEIDEICTRHDIEYFIDYGTLLGAVRHGGFIPWDDDIDITMKESEYYRFIDVCKQELDGKTRGFTDGRLDRDYPTLVGRYNDYETPRVGGHSKFWDYECGQCIDVLVYKEMPVDPVEQREAFDRFYAYDEYQNASYRHFRMKTEHQMELFREHLAREKVVGREQVLREEEAFVYNQHYEGCDTVLRSSASYNAPITLLPAEYYDHAIRMEFEGHMLPVPCGYIEALTTYYGDTYCDIPEKKLQHSQQSNTGLNCRDYVDDYMRLVDKNAMLVDRRAAKELAVEEGYRQTRNRHRVYEKLASMILFKIQQRIEREQIDLASLMDASDPKKLATLHSIFAEYLRKQLNGGVRSWRIYFDIGDDLVYAALFALVYYRNDYSGVDKIMRLRRFNFIPADPRIDGLWDLVQTVRAIKAATFYGNYEKAESLLAYAQEHYPHCREVHVCRMLLDVKLAELDPQPAVLDAVQAAAKKLHAANKRDPQCVKALGDICWARGDIDGARKHYDWILNESVNGMLQRDVNKRLEVMAR